MRMIGIDIGGTKCRVSLGNQTGGALVMEGSCEARSTAGYSPRDMLEQLLRDAESLTGEGQKIRAIGISCGGPLDQDRGIILSPPNLPGWDEIHITEFFQTRTGIPAYLYNDANAGALAEWKYGAGKGCRDLVFITFGTGIGAGLILDGRLYSGASGQAGEIGHLRLTDYGPPGYGKMGSLEGFCSGGGIVKLARSMVEAELQQGRTPGFCPSPEALDGITAKTLGDAAEQGDPLARRIYREVGTKLGQGLSVVIDVLNPEIIVIGSIFTRSKELLWPAAREVIEREALPLARQVCRVEPSMLGNEIGNYAALAAAQYGSEGLGTGH
ncbi:MAG: ROK family protein [Spirochaetaceae bacterium]|nr:ROK family protein [Spirochaetaceae bacterium]